MMNSNQPQATDTCAYYGRVSTKPQKLEHQREAVNTFLAGRGITIPDSLRFEDKERRHKSQKREHFQRLLELCQRGKIDWIIIATFDRWGVADVDEFFALRGRLREYRVRLWSVNDQLELTGCEDADYFRVISHAVGATGQMASQADRNIMKMVQMATDGWHASGNVPFGMDLVCCPLTDKSKVLYRVHTIARPRDGKAVYKVIHSDGKEEISNRMPLRDCKETGYRLAPGIDPRRIEAVRMIYELYDSEMSWHDMRRHLWARGYSHYGHPFQDNAMLTILQNPAYIGKPAWGKYAIGHYRQVFNKASQKPRYRQREEPTQYFKDEEHFIFPRESVFAADAFLPKGLWERVQASFLEKKKHKVSRPRRRNRTNHSLNGKVRCPDCGSVMVTGQCTNRNGNVEQYFYCGQYAKTQHIACRANTTPWAKLDVAANEWLERVRTQLGDFSKLNLTDDTALCRHVDEWVASFKLAWKIIQQMMDELGLSPSPALRKAAQRESISGMGKEFAKVQRQYAKLTERRKSKREEDLAEVAARIEKLGGLIEELPPGLFRTKKITELGELEQQRQRMVEQSGDLVEQLQTAVRQAQVILDLLGDSTKGCKAKVWDVVLSSVTPVMQAEMMKNGKSRTHVTGFRFHPNAITAEALDALEIPCTPKGTDSEPRPT